MPIFPNIIFTFAKPPFSLPNLFGFNLAPISRISKVISPSINLPVCGISDNNPSSCYFNYHYDVFELGQNFFEIFATSHYGSTAGNATIFSTITYLSPITNTYTLYAGPVYIQKPFDNNATVDPNLILSISSALLVLYWHF